MVHLGSQHSFCGGMLRITYVEFAGNITVRADTAHVADWIWIFRKVFLNFLFVCLFYRLLIINLKEAPLMKQ